MTIMVMRTSKGGYTETDLHEMSIDDFMQVYEACEKIEKAIADAMKK